MFQLVWIIYKKVYDTDVDKLKIVPIDLKKLNDVLSKEIVKKESVQQTKYKSKRSKEENSWYDYFKSHESTQLSYIKFGEKN